MLLDVRNNCYDTKAFCRWIDPRMTPASVTQVSKMGNSSYLKCFLLPHEQNYLYLDASINASQNATLE